MKNTKLKFINVLFCIFLESQSPEDVIKMTTETELGKNLMKQNHEANDLCNYVVLLPHGC